MPGWFHRRRADRRPEEPQEARLARRYRALRDLLAANNDALECITELESDLLLLPAGDARIRAHVERLLGHTDSVVEHLDRLADGRYGDLRMVLGKIRADVARTLDQTERAEAGPLVLPLAELDRGDGPRVGGKAAHLAALRNAGLPVPYGFALTTAAYRLFARETGLVDRIRAELARLDLDDLASLERTSGRLRAHVLEAAMPPLVEDAIRAGVQRLLRRSSEGLAVRSSACGEDAVLTFAGQYDSRVNIPEAGLAAAYREVVASRFNARAIYYRQSAGAAEVESPMAVLFLRMVQARTSGVMYTRDPGDPDASTLVIGSTWGCCFTDMAGGDVFRVSRRRGRPVVERRVARKERRLAAAPEGGTREEAVPDELVAAPSLTDAEIDELAALGLRAEELFGEPQDLEWAIDESGIWLLQSRRLCMNQAARSRPRAPRHVEPLVTGGVTIFPGQVSGPACVLDDPSADVPDGAIVVLGHTSPECVKFLSRIGGLVVDRGNPAGHAAALVREFRVPALFEAGDATARLRAGEVVSLDAAGRRVYPGAHFPTGEARVERLRERRVERRQPLADRITSLTLLDPKAWSFKPGLCRSVHDIVRFAHEKAIQAVFHVGDSEVEARNPGIKVLESELPIRLYVLDLGGGLVEEARGRKSVRPEDVRSVPFAALWRGMSHPGVSWSGREYVSLSGFASAVTHALAGPGHETRALGSQSYVAIAESYVNFNSRLAYHYAMVDACIEDRANANFVNFRFKGGATEMRRKNLRARFLAECLAQHGFSVDVRQDLVNAWLRKLPRADMERHLDVVGRLMACARQLDMFMSSERAMRWFVEQFQAGNYRFSATGGSEPPPGLAPPNPGSDSRRGTS